MSTRSIGKVGENIARLLWPSLIPVANIEEDKKGTDAYLDGKRVQIKTDRRIATSGNLYMEQWEKSIDRPDQKPRESPCNADIYIFVTHNLAIKIDTKELTDTCARLGLPLKTISETSCGFLIPIESLQKHEKIFHPWTITNTTIIPVY